MGSKGGSGKLLQFYKSIFEWFYFFVMGKTNTKIRIGFTIKNSETQIVFLLVKIGLST